MFDIGGQRTERRKWLHCFQEVSAVLFVVAISEYDQKLEEDNSTIRLQEALHLFSEICNSRWFVDSAIILFLNKTDIFLEKIKRVDLRCCFPNYSGPANDPDAAAKFIANTFTATNQSSYKHIYCHFTVATDTNHIRQVFDSVKDIMLHNHLKDSNTI